MADEDTPLLKELMTWTELSRQTDPSWAGIAANDLVVVKRRVRDLGGDAVSRDAVAGFLASAAVLAATHHSLVAAVMTAPDPTSAQVYGYAANLLRQLTVGVAHIGKEWLDVGLVETDLEEQFREEGETGG